VSTEAIQHSCPSCGRPTILSTYSPEPALCVECQRALGVLPADEERQPLATPPHGPDNPVWGSIAAFGVWLASLVALTAAQAGAVVYVAYAGRRGLHIPAFSEYMTDPTLAFVLILSSGIAHLLTLLIVFYIVTDGGRLNFFSSIGWRWPERLRMWHVFFVAVGLQIFTTLIAILISAPESTSFSRMIAASPWTKAATAVIAIATAPLVEEFVYRGVLYPALARRFGRSASIVVVSVMFAMVHFGQYDGALAIMIPLFTLSLVLTMLRAYTGSLIPSVALHIFFNGITVVMMYVAGDKAV
jgi:membrane protease YdiL (CAAX protease family)